MQSVLKCASAGKAVARRQAVRVFAVASAPASAKMALTAEAKARAKAAILGGLVADAATMPLHWIYDIPKINELLKAEGRTETPEFFPTPSCPFYQGVFGEQSPYGAELVPLLKTVSEKGNLGAADYSQAIVDYFTSNTAYRNASIRGVIANHEAGKRGIECGHDKDFQANCFAKAAILVAKYGGQPELLEKTETAIRVQQNNADAVRWGTAGARILEKVVVDGHSVEAALQWAAGEGSGIDSEVVGYLRKALAAKEAGGIKELQFEVAEYMKDMMNKHIAIKDELPAYTWSVWCNGPACGNPAALTNVALTVATFSSYVEGVRANLMAGGDNCSRSCLIGALLAAQNGLESIPQEWRDKTKGYAEYEALVDKLLA